MDVQKALRRHGGAARIGSLKADGVTEWSIRTAVDSGELVKLRPGVVSLPDAPGEYLQAYQENGLVSCVSAAQFYRLWVLTPPDRLHVRCSHARAGADVVLHRGSLSVPRQLEPVAGLADVLLDALHCLPARDALVMVQCAVGRGDIALGYLLRLLPGNRNGRARNVLQLVRRRADSVPEILAWALFRQHGIYCRMHVLLDGIGEVDFLVEEFLVVEIDGDTHWEKRQFKKDRRRDNRSVVGGYVVLRFLYEDIVHRPEETMRIIKAVLGGRIIRFRDRAA